MLLCANKNSLCLHGSLCMHSKTILIARFLHDNSFTFKKTPLLSIMFLTKRTCFGLPNLASLGSLAITGQLLDGATLGAGRRCPDDTGSYGGQTSSHSHGFPAVKTHMDCFRWVSRDTITINETVDVMAAFKNLQIYHLRSSL